MKDVEFAQGWAYIFEKAGLCTVNDFLRLDQGCLVNINKRREVLTFSLDDEHGTRHFFLKRFLHPHLKDMLSTLRSFGFLCSQAQCEWRNAHALLANGIDTYHPGYG